MSAKPELRQRIRKILGDIPAAQLHAKSHRACNHLFEQKEFRKAEVIMLFLSLPLEVDTTPVVLKAWQTRKRVLAPRVSWNQRRIVPIEIRSLTDDLAVSSLGIREPISGTPFPISIIDLIVMPGLGFDEFGHRLGRGQGFYDKFIASAAFRGTTCGLAFEEQVLQNVPVGPLDRSVDMLVTDEKVRRFQP